MRQGMSFWLCEQAGSPASFYYPVRLQLNGQFYQLANHNDVQTEELLIVSATTETARSTTPPARSNPANSAPAALKRKPANGRGTRIICNWRMRSPNPFRLPHGGQMSSRCWTSPT